MISLYGVLAGIIFALVGIRKGFFPMWAVFCNTLVAVYLGVMLCPMIIEAVPPIGSFGYRCGGCVGGVAVLVFVVLQTIATGFITGKYKVSFPKVFNKTACMVLGFVSGYIMISFVIFVIGITPLAQLPIMEKICPRGDSVAKVRMPIVKTCDFLGAICLQDDDNPAGDVVDWLIEPGYEPMYTPQKPARTQ